MTCSVRCCSIEIRYLDCKRLCATLKVWANRCCKDSELIFISRLYTDNRIAAEHIRTDV